MTTNTAPRMTAPSNTCPRCPADAHGQRRMTNNAAVSAVRQSVHLASIAYANAQLASPFAISEARLAAKAAYSAALKAEWAAYLAARAR